MTTGVSPNSFAGCIRGSGSSITFGEGITSIGEDAFTSCAVDYCILPNSIRRIEAQAFAVTHLSNLTLMGGVSYFGDECFAGHRCSTLNFTNLSSPCWFGYAAFGTSGPGVSKLILGTLESRPLWTYIFNSSLAECFASVGDIEVGGT